MAKKEYAKRERAGIGRPPGEIDYSLVRRLSGIGCTVEEISVAIGYGREYVFERIRRGDGELDQAITQGREQGRSTLRRLQWQKANTGDTTMMIWLGKQMLKQRDKMAHTDEEGGPVAIEHSYRWQKPDDSDSS